MRGKRTTDQIQKIKSLKEKRFFFEGTEKEKKKTGNRERLPMGKGKMKRVVSWDSG